MTYMQCSKQINKIRDFQLQIADVMKSDFGYFYFRRESKISLFKHPRRRSHGQQLVTKQFVITRALSQYKDRFSCKERMSVRP